MKVCVCKGCLGDRKSKVMNKVKMKQMGKYLGVKGKATENQQNDNRSERVTRMLQGMCKIATVGEENETLTVVIQSTLVSGQHRTTKMKERVNVNRRGDWALGTTAITGGIPILRRCGMSVTRFLRTWELAPNKGRKRREQKKNQRWFQIR